MNQKVSRKRQEATPRSQRRWKVVVLSECKTVKPNAKELKLVLSDILSEVEAHTMYPPPPPYAKCVSVLLTDNNHIRDLNRKYRGKDKPTDVLSFSYIEAERCTTHQDTLGDLVISVETAQRQARHARISLGQEIIRLLIHGILHLFGYDHEGVGSAEAQKMRRTEKKLFEKYKGKSAHVYVTIPSKL